jgi:hypothetical protein
MSSVLTERFGAADTTNSIDITVVQVAPPVAKMKSISPVIQATCTDIPKWLPGCAVIVAGIGMIWREWWVLLAHRPDRAIYSDMANYCHLATHLTQVGYQQTASDTVQAQGMGFYLAFWHLMSGSWVAATWSSLFVCLLIPIAAAWMAYRLLGPMVAWITLIICSLHFPFIDYGGYFLAETPFMALLLGGIILMLRSLRLTSPTSVAIWAVAAGVCFGLSATMKSHGLLVAIAFAIWLGNRARMRSSLRPALTASGLLLGSLLAVSPMCLRTSALVGHPSFISTNGPLNVLIGHYDPKVATFRFLSHGHVERWSSPSTLQRGARRTVDCHFPSYDGSSCLAMAWDWIRAHPFDAVMLSCDHVLDLYSLNTYPWPTASTSWRHWTSLSEHLTLFVITIPGALGAIIVFRRGNQRQRRAVVILVIPVCCLWLTVFLTSSEPRYRVPFDLFTIVLAALFYARVFPVAQRFRANIPGSQTDVGSSWTTSDPRSLVFSPGSAEACQ